MSDETKFTYFANVLSGIRQYDLVTFGGWNEFQNQLAKSAFRLRRTTSSTNNMRVESLLRNSWRTEAAARWPFEMSDGNLCRVLSHTLAMHVYYSLFNSARALTLAEGTPVSKHDGVHRDFRKHRRDRAVGSLSFAATGDPGRRNTIRIVPGDLEIVSGSGLSHSLAPFEYLALGLLTARNMHWDYKKDAFVKDEGVLRLVGRRRDLLLSRNPESSLMDLLFHLRRRANYEEINEYDSLVDDQVIMRFYDGLVHIGSSGLLLYESMLAGVIGIQAYVDMVERWLTTFRLSSSAPTLALADRVDVIRGLS